MFYFFLFNFYYLFTYLSIYSLSLSLRNFGISNKDSFSFFGIVNLISFLDISSINLQVLPILKAVS
jgi:hypothetical protein